MDQSRNKFRMVDHKILGKVDCHGQPVVWRQGLVENPGYVMYERMEWLGRTPCWVGRHVG